MASQKQYQGIPLPEAPLVGPSGQATYVWYRFLSTLWLQISAANVALAAAVVLQQVNGVIQAVSSATGKVIATLLTSSSAGGTPQVLTVTITPWAFAAPSVGTLLVESGQVTIGRSGTTSVVGLQGGAIPLMTGDTVSVLWYRTAPRVVWLPAA